MKKFIEVEKAKMNVYNIFTAMFCEPEKEILQNPELYNTLKENLKVLSPKFVDYSDELQKSVKQYTQQELLIEYSRLFIGPFKLAASPYSAMYLGESKQLMSDDTLWVINFIEGLNLQINQSIKDAPDHIAIELEILYILIFNCLSNIEKNNKIAGSYFDKQRLFFDQHFSKWIPLFCERLAENTQNSFYKTIAYCLKSFVNNMPFESFSE